MTNYVLLYSGGGMPESEEEQQAVMAAWGAWYEKAGAAIVDGGNPFGAAKPKEEKKSAADKKREGQAFAPPAPRTRGGLSGNALDDPFASSSSTPLAGKMADPCGKQKSPKSIMSIGLKHQPITD